MTLPLISSLWVGAPVTYLELVVIQSFLDAGHPVEVYTDSPGNVFPNGVKIRDPRSILPNRPVPTTAQTRLETAVYSDIFRLALLQDHACIWVDLDAYCVRAFDFETDHLFGENGRGKILNGVLSLPPDAPALSEYRAFLEQDCPVPPWFRWRRKSALRLARNRGETWDINRFDWGVSGPDALSYFLDQYALTAHAQPAQVFYSSLYEARSDLFRPAVPIGQIEHPETVSVHFFGRSKQDLWERPHQNPDLPRGTPPRLSYFERICQKHGIDPTSAPIQPLPGWVAK